MSAQAFSVGHPWRQRCHDQTNAITRASQAGNTQEVLRLSERLNPLWALFSQHGGSLRVVATAAELKGLAASPCLPRPLKALEGADRQELAGQLHELQLT